MLSVTTILFSCSSYSGKVIKQQKAQEFLSYSYDIKIPDQSEWIEQGAIIQNGRRGEWDHFLYGGFTGTVLKNNESYYLYYQGAPEYSAKYGTVKYRAIGVATSHDGVNFVKYHNNPVISWLPNESIEEGAVSGGALLNPNGEIIVYYGANTKESEWTINSDIRLAISSDGLEFLDYGIVLSHNDDLVWGFGDELFPIIAIYDRNTWYVYYIPNGTNHKGQLGVAWGDDMINLANTRPALSKGEAVTVWGMGGYAKIGTNLYALFINNVRESRMTVFAFHLDHPDQLSRPIKSYKFDNFSQGTVFLDSEANKWLMFYRTKNHSYHVKVAPIRKMK